MSEHNPSVLTREEYDAEEGWRLLDTDEVALDLGAPQGVEVRCFGEWNQAASSHPLYTYRTKLTRAELRAARGVPPEQGSASDAPEAATCPACPMCCHEDCICTAEQKAGTEDDPSCPECSIIGETACPEHGAPSDPVARQEGEWTPKVGDWFILKTSYCGGDNPSCTNEAPCADCLAMCNRFVITASHCGKDFFFGGGWCNRDGGCELNETYSYVLTTDPERVKPFGDTSLVSEATPIPNPENASLTQQLATVTKEKTELLATLAVNQIHRLGLTEDVKRLRDTVAQLQQERDEARAELAKATQERDAAVSRMEEVIAAFPDARAEGRKEGLEILLREDAETFADEYTQSSPLADTGDFVIGWDAEKLQTLFDIAVRSSLIDRLEGLYWSVMGRTGDLDRTRKERDDLRARLLATEAALEQCRVALTDCREELKSIWGAACFDPDTMPLESLKAFPRVIRESADRVIEATADAALAAAPSEVLAQKGGQ